MTASLTLTPSQARFMQETRERRQRLAAKAKPPVPRAEPAPVVFLNPPPPANNWAKLQIQQYDPWFLIEDEIDPPKPKNPPIFLIQRVTAKHYGVAVADILSARRTASVVLPRQVAVYITKMLTPRSLPEIGRKFGGRDHTTILSSIRKITRLIESDEGLKTNIKTIISDIGDAFV